MLVDVLQRQCISKHSTITMDFCLVGDVKYTPCTVGPRCVAQFILGHTSVSGPCSSDNMRSLAGILVHWLRSLDKTSFTILTYRVKTPLSFINVVHFQPCFRPSDRESQSANPYLCKYTLVRPWSVPGHLTPGYHELRDDFIMGGGGMWRWHGFSFQHGAPKQHSGTLWGRRVCKETTQHHHSCNTFSKSSPRSEIGLP